MALLKRALVASPDFEWLGEPGGAFWFGVSADNRLVRAIHRLLALAGSADAIAAAKELLDRGPQANGSPESVHPAPAA